ncbi:MAG: hypothetical protein SGCHY_000108 [Lobulomycetales sp.]
MSSSTLAPQAASTSADIDAIAGTVEVCLRYALLVSLLLSVINPALYSLGLVLYRALFPRRPVSVSVEEAGAYGGLLGFFLGLSTQLPLASLLSQIVFYMSSSLDVEAEALAPALSWISLAALVASLLLSLASLRWSQRKLLGVKSLPEPSASVPLLGILPNILLHHWHRKHDWFLEQLEILGETFLARFPFGMKIVVTSNLDNIEHILKTNFPVWDKGKIYHDNIVQLLGETGIFCTDGKVWKTQRKISSNIFTIKNFKNLFTTVFEDHSIVLARFLSNAAASGQTVDMTKLFFAFTMDSFGSSDFKCLKDPETPVPFAKSFDAVSSLPSPPNPASKAQSIVVFRFVNILWKLTEPFTSARGEMKRHVAVVHDFANSMIQKRRACREEESQPGGCKGPPRKPDLLDLFMDSAGAEGEDLSDDQLRDIVLNFIIAGRDTTAQALAWSVWLLQLHPDVSAKLRSEAFSVLGTDTSRLAAYDDMRRLPYAHAVFFEVLRLYPSVPSNVKVCNEDDELPDGTFVAKGSRVIFSPYAMGRLTRIWGPDAKEFNPERWLVDGALRKESQIKFPAFNAGPRICLGQNLATQVCSCDFKLICEQEAVTVLTLLVRAFDFEMLPDQEITYIDSLTLPMKNGLKVKVHNYVPVQNEE